MTEYSPLTSFNGRGNNMQAKIPYSAAHRWFAILVAASLVSMLAYSQDSPKPTQFVVVHSPGPAWKPGVPPFEQAGLQLHVAHYAQFLKQGKLLMGGPFLDAQSGGIMIAEPGVTEAELRAFAAADPAVKSGLLTFEVRPWLAGLHQ
jgi:uncharacterized protein YciI